MKKVYLFLTAMLLVSGSFAQTATLQIFDIDGNDVTNGSYAIPAIQPSGDTETKLFIKNTGSDPVSVKVSRSNVQMPPGFSNFLCFGVTCFPATANVTTFATEIQPSQTDSSFHGLYRNNDGTTGDLCVTYTFFDENNPDNSVTVRVYFGNCLTMSVAETAMEAPSISAFPNPASGSVWIKYNNIVGDAQLIITDITGKMLKNIRLNSGTQSAQIDISDLRAGVYVYSVQSGSKRIASKKLVVR